MQCIVLNAGSIQSGQRKCREQPLGGDLISDTPHVVTVFMHYIIIKGRLRRHSLAVPRNSKTGAACR